MEREACASAMDAPDRSREETLAGTPAVEGEHECGEEGKERVAPGAPHWSRELCRRKRNMQRRRATSSRVQRWW